MEGKKDYVVIDAGNTNIKIAFFKLSDIIEIQHFTIDQIDSVFKSNPEFRNLPGIISSVVSKENTSKIRSLFTNCIELTSDTNLPFQLSYSTPTTLGKDRICNAAYAYYKNLNGNAVTIDIGTCIKFDLITTENGYEGGSISPGIQLRYKSLNDYTANLPLIDNHGKIGLVGKTTNESIHSGVINGIQSEINDLIIRYTEKYEGLTFFVTGGDAKYFDFDSKNNIFAIENLTLRGLSQIFLFNDQ